MGTNYVAATNYVPWALELICWMWKITLITWILGNYLLGTGKKNGYSHWQLAKGDGRWLIVCGTFFIWPQMVLLPIVYMKNPHQTAFDLKLPCLLCGQNGVRTISCSCCFCSFIHLQWQLYPGQGDNLEEAYADNPYKWVINETKEMKQRPWSCEAATLPVASPT